MLKSFVVAAMVAGCAAPAFEFTVHIDDQVSVVTMDGIVTRERTVGFDTYKAAMDSAGVEVQVDHDGTNTVTLIVPGICATAGVVDINEELLRFRVAADASLQRFDYECIHGNTVFTSTD